MKRPWEWSGHSCHNAMESRHTVGKAEIRVKFPDSSVTRMLGNHSPRIGPMPPELCRNVASRSIHLQEAVGRHRSRESQSPVFELICGDLIEKLSEGPTGCSRTRHSIEKTCHPNVRI